LVINGYIPVGNGRFIDGPFDIETPLCELAISGPGTTASGLLVQMLFAHDAADFEIASDMMVIENDFDLQIDLGGAAQSGLGAGQSFAQLAERLDGRGNVAAASGRLVQRQ
jgi:hypothetical protein